MARTGTDHGGTPPDVRVRTEALAVLERARAEGWAPVAAADRVADLARAAVIETVALYLDQEAAHAKAKAVGLRRDATYLRRRQREARAAGRPADPDLAAETRRLDTLAQVHAGYATIFAARAAEHRKSAP